jgi:hypothetical protein
MFPTPIGGLRSAGAMAAFFLTTLGGCAVVDQYGSRATEYNEQTAASKSSTILLNILRAAYHEPLQFTDISTVTGTASAQGSINANLPFRVGGPNLTSAQLFTINPAASMSGGPQFSVGNLNTQEFYRGLQSPVDTRIIANFKDAGISLNVLLPLLISDIEVRNRDTITQIHNSGSTWLSYREFLSAVENLVAIGLDVVERPNPDEFIGPVLTRKEASDPELLSGLAQAIATAQSGDGPSLTLQGIKSIDGRTSSSQFRLRKPGTKSAGFCFKRKVQPYPRNVDYTVSRIQKGVQPLHIPLAFAHGSVLTLHTAYCGSPGLADKSSGAKHSASEDLSLTVRSVEGVFLFLGEIVRTELGLKSGEPVVLVNSENGDPSNGVPFYLFKIEQRLPSPGEISANFHGLTYTISADASGADASSQVVQLLTDLLALQSSAKALPAPNVIAVVP